MLRNPNGTIVSQCWAYRAKDNNILFDSVETHLNFRKQEQITVDFFTLLGKKLVEEHAVPRIVVGTGGETPKTLGVINSEIPSQLDSYRVIYSDAFRQRIIADKDIPFVSIYIKNNQPKQNPNGSFQCGTQLKDDKVHLLNKKSILELCHLCSINKIDLNSIIDIKPSLLELQLTENFVEECMKLVNEWKGIFFRMLTIFDADKQMNLLNKVKDFFLKYNSMNFNANIFDIPVEDPAIGRAAKMFYETKTSSWEFIKIFVDNGANINAKDEQGRTPLHVSAKCGDIESVRYLIQNGANPNATDNVKNTPLDLASSAANWDIVKYIIEYVLEKNIKMEFSTVIKYAKEHKKFDVLNVLSQKGLYGEPVYQSVFAQTTSTTSVDTLNQNNSSLQISTTPMNLSQ